MKKRIITILLLLSLLLVACGNHGMDKAMIKTADGWEFEVDVESFEKCGDLIIIKTTYGWQYGVAPENVTFYSESGTWNIKSDY